MTADIDHSSGPSLGGIEEAKKSTSGQKRLPPVHLWNPDFNGDIDMRIATDGSWHYMGSPISRPAMVRLFSTILRKDDDKYFLVTPVEKVGILVEDAPFVAVEMTVSGQGEKQVLTFRTNVDDVAAAGREHPIRVEIDPETAEPRPYILVRAALDALINRPVFYEMADLGVEERVGGAPWFGVWSSGAFFPITEAEKLAGV
jgi:hypothetical protein